MTILKCIGNRYIFTYTIIVHLSWLVSLHLHILDLTQPIENTIINLLKCFSFTNFVWNLLKPIFSLSHYYYILSPKTSPDGVVEKIIADYMWAATWQSQQSDCAPAKTQNSLGIRPVWSESSLSAWRKHGPLATHEAHSEDSDQTGRMSRLIWVFSGRTFTLLVFVMSRLSYV